MTNVRHNTIQVPGLGKYLTRRVWATGLLGEALGGVWRAFSGAGIDVEHEKKVDLGVLGVAGCHERVQVSPFSTVDTV